MSTPTLCPMPLQVDRMPLSWYCLTTGSSESTGFRLWGDRAREPVFRVTYGERDNGSTFYQVSALECGAWVPFVWFNANDEGAYERAIRCAEGEEASRFNSAQLDPRVKQPDGKWVAPVEPVR